MDQSGGGRLAVGAGDADHLVRRQLRPRLREQLDVPDDLHPLHAGLRGERVRVEGHARRENERVEGGQVVEGSDN